MFWLSNQSHSPGWLCLYLWPFSTDYSHCTVDMSSLKEIYGLHHRQKIEYCGYFTYKNKFKKCIDLIRRYSRHKLLMLRSLTKLFWLCKCNSSSSFQYWRQICDQVFFDQLSNWPHHLVFPSHLNFTHQKNQVRYISNVSLILIFTGSVLNWITWKRSITFTVHY